MDRETNFSLNSDFYRILGQYCQAWVHIERTASVLHRVVSGSDLEETTPQKYEEALERADMVKALPEEIKLMAPEFHYTIQNEVLQVCERLDKLKVRREMATHGIWSVREDGCYHAEYFEPFHTNSGFAARRIDAAAVTRDELVGALEDAWRAVAELADIGHRHLNLVPNKGLR